MINIFGHYISRVYFWVFIIEYFLFYCSMYSAIFIRFINTQPWYSNDANSQSSFLFATIISLTAIGLGLYNKGEKSDQRIADFQLLHKIALTYIISIFILFSIYYVFPTFAISRKILLYAFAISIIFWLTERHFFYKYAKIKQFKRKVLVLGCGERALFLDTIVSHEKNTDFIIIGFININEKNVAIKVNQNKIINNIESISDVAVRLNADEIVVALDDRRGGMPVDDLLDCKISGIKILDLLSFFEKELRFISLVYLYPSWFIFSDGFYRGHFKYILKRVTDILFSLSLLIVASPIMIVAFIAILIEGNFRHPVLFSQYRVGHNGKIFKLYKFRSMKMDAEVDGAKWAKENDPRVTRIGNFLRKSRIDELPQIFNVLLGEMSFVGPRPERPEFVEGFIQKIPYYDERHRIKPGITGWAQLRYPYGASEFDTIQKLQYDLYYAKNQSFFLDLTIVIHTVEVMLWRKGGR